MTTLPSISIIITVYNRAFFLGATIESVLAQTRKDFELLIWDDGSTDDSVAIARQYEQQDDRIRVVASCHQGLSPTLKAAVAATIAPFVGWVDSDDLLAPTALEETAAVLETLPQVGMVYTNYHLIDASGRDHGLGHTCKVPYSPKRLLVDFMTFHFRLIRRSMYERVGGIDPTYPTAEDYDLCLRLSEVTEIQHLARPLYFYRRHSANKTNEQMLTIQWTQRAIEAAIRRRNLDSHYQLHTRLVAYFSLQSRSTTPQPRKAVELVVPKPRTPLVSIVIPCHNAAPRLDACLKSCVAQTYPNLEILVVDNQSTDDSMLIAKHWSEQTERPIRILQCETLGANAARNWGFQQAKGDYIQWLDADDELEPKKLSLQVNALEQQVEVDVAFGDWEWQFVNQNQTTQFKFAGQQYSDMPLQMLWDNWRPPHCYLLRRSVAERLDRLQAWHPETRICMDREYFTIAALLGLRFQYVPGSLVRYHWWSANQLSRSRSYQERVVSRAQMFQRFRDLSEVRWAAGIPENYRFLLQQNWEIWLPAFTIHHKETHSVLKHSETNVELALSRPQQQIATALSSLSMPQTLEDLSRWVLRQIWSKLITRISEDSNALLTTQQLTEELAVQLGFSVPSFPTSVTDSDRNETGLLITPLLHDFPLFAPSFGEYRLIVQGFLESLRQHGWLKRLSR
ncbi:glycosyltransferase family 2 protein [Leptolyngbya sp. NIES-2104]|uniref:glycosyltransferase family 2 protein n=1 Tax=Leptolyngbya sp. NIES-2104 TaxID=1552121 RepID=UPI0006ECC7A8|nr:glycosyltransferase [Leptolyngbya sp. NIES-2104]GAQ00069.1 probable glycosyl transferase [Leptolyngbya sp. NIES-2104]